MTQYQSFPSINGNSDSLEKLKALRLPILTNKRFLDVGCNRGFFCGYAHFEGASEVIGIDKSAASIEYAKTIFPDCNFLQCSWNNLPDGPFDVILLASALHYAEDQAALIQSLVDRLSKDGTLVLEMGIANSKKNEWVKVKRSIDERYFPSPKKLEEILEPYAWKKIGHSVKQAGDPIMRYVIHITPKKPYVFLLMSLSGSGKTTFCRNILKDSKIPILSGDSIYSRINNNKLQASSELKKLIQDNFETTKIAALTKQIFLQSLLSDLIDVWCKQAGYRDFALDSYVPDEHHPMIREAFYERGYIPVTLNWMINRSTPAPPDAIKKAEDFFLSLHQDLKKNNHNVINIKSLNNNSMQEHLNHWHLDFPQPNQIFLDNLPMRLSGWALPHASDMRKLKFYTQNAAQENIHDFNKYRHEVVKKHYPDQISQRCRIKYGFDVNISPVDISQGIELGFILDSHKIPVARIKAEQRMLTPMGRLVQKAKQLLRQI